MWRGPPRCLLAKPSGRAAGLTLGGVVLTVNGDGALVERQLAGGELACCCASLKMSMVVSLGLIVCSR